MLNTTLCYVTQGDEVLMLHRVKKKNDLNKDKWIGIGGKFEGEETEYKIVSTAESDPIEGRISDDSPLGKALLGHRKGDSINVETPVGIVRYTVTGISK